MHRLYKKNAYCCQCYMEIKRYFLVLTDVWPMETNENKATTQKREVVTQLRDPHRVTHHTHWGIILSPKYTSRHTD